MNQEIEDYIAGIMEDGDLTGAPDIFTGTSSEIRLPENHAVLVTADQVENVVQTLYKATIKVMVSSPTDSREDHATLAKEVRALIEAALPTPSGFTVGGLVIRSCGTGTTEDNRWLTTCEAMLGLTFPA